jgi:hypothetical protein
MQAKMEPQKNEFWVARRMVPRPVLQLDSRSVCTPIRVLENIEKPLFFVSFCIQKQ